MGSGKGFLIILYFFCSITCFSQSAMVSAGGDATNSTGSVSFSMGQIDYLTKGNGHSTVSTGVQQAIIRVVEKSDDIGENVSNPVTKQVKLSVYPNPTHDYCYISIPDCSVLFQYTISDVNGRILLSGNVSNNSKLSFASLEIGTYLLTIIQNHQELVTFKIIKE